MDLINYYDLHKALRRAEVLVGKLQYLVEELVERPRAHTDEYYENKMKDQAIRHVNELTALKAKRRKK